MDLGFFTMPIHPPHRALADTLQSVTKLRGTVETVSPGSLPNDGKVIDDIRKFD